MKTSILLSFDFINHKTDLTNLIIEYITFDKFKDFLFKREKP